MTVKSLTNQEAQTRHESIKRHVKEIKKNSFDLGKELYIFNEEKQYKDLDYSSFKAYISDPEIDFGIATAYMLMGIYEDFILRLNIPKVRLLDSSPSKLDIIRSHATVENLPELLAQSETLGRTDLRKWTREKFGKQNGHDPFPDKIKMLKSMVWDTLELKMNPIVRGLLEQVYKMLDVILEKYETNI